MLLSAAGAGSMISLFVPLIVFFSFNVFHDYASTKEQQRVKKYAGFWRLVTVLQPAVLWDFNRWPHLEEDVIVEFGNTETAEFQ